MFLPSGPADIYQLHILLLDINPPVWRRLHVRSDTSIAMLHELLQIAFDWSDFHLHRFLIRGKAYGIAGWAAAGSRPTPEKWFYPNFGSGLMNGFFMSMISLICGSIRFDSKA